MPQFIEDVSTSVCSNCCGAKTDNHCCRILTGNYGKLVSVYDIVPVRIAVTGQLITINGYNFSIISFTSHIPE